MLMMVFLFYYTGTSAIKRVVLAIAAWNKGLALAAVWGLWAFAMCCLWYPYLRKEASPAARASLVWSTKGDGSFVRLAGVSFYVDGTRGEAPQDAMEWIIDASLTAASLFALCVVVYTVGVALGLPPY